MRNLPKCDILFNHTGNFPDLHYVQQALRVTMCTGAREGFVLQNASVGSSLMQWNNFTCDIIRDILYETELEDMKMVKVIMHGCNGKMGQVINGLVKQDEQIEIVAGVDSCDGIQNSYPVFTSIDKCDVEADVVIDFSNSSAVDGLLDYCVAKGLPVVLCTTGLSEGQLDKMKAASEKIAVLKSANMSLGINLLLKLLKDASKVLAPAGYDIELVERHHNQKVDAPSGTALALADSINEALGNEYEYVYDRSRVRRKREKKEIGISAVRGGTIVGDHEIIFAGTDEVIEFRHTAYSRSVFGKGAVEAAKILAGQPAGMYDMGDVIRL